MKFEFGKNKKIYEFKEFLFEKHNRKTIALIVAATVIIGLAQGTKGLTGGKKYITDNKGNVVGLSRKSGSDISSYPLKFKAHSGKVESDKDIIITLKGKMPQGDASVKEADPLSAINEKVSEAVDNIENTEKEQIMLPTKLSDGTRIEWSKNVSGNLPAVIMLPLALIMFLYWNSKRKIQSIETANMDSIKRALPAFNNQLLMLLNCGLIFNDAFKKIAAGYKKKGSDNSYFEKTVLNIEKESEETNRSLISVLTDNANRIGIREFSRIVSIISDNQYKGVDLTGKLESESSILWNQRKKLAEEKGKLAETRLTFPLALLLIVLILVTAAPAVLQVKGG